MEVRAQLNDVSFDTNGKQRITFTLDHRVDVSGLTGDIRLKAVKWREKRSLNANGLLWKCLDKIAESLNTDKWPIYLMMLKRYGKFSYVLVKPEAVQAMQDSWRESEVIGDIDVNGDNAVQMLCYYGSHTYDTKEFSRLLSGVISEMKEMGIPTPEEEDMDRALKEWEKQTNGRNTKAS